MGANANAVDTNANETPLARYIREQGRLKGWLAAQIGVDRSRLSRLISGETTFRLDEAARAARALGVDIDELLPGGGAE